MPFVTPDGQAVLRRHRMLWHGAPGTRKTTALLQLPPPVAILSLPGEKGYDTIPERPEDRPGIFPFSWAHDKSSSSAMVKDAEDLLMGWIVDRTYASIGVEGIHKLFDYVLDAASDGAYLAGDEYDGRRVWPRAFGRFKDFLSRICATQAPLLVFTCWAAPEKDRPKRAGEKESEYGLVPAHIYPDLPGQLSKTIMGEFPVVLYQSLRKLKLEDKEAVATWQTRPSGEVWGAGIKAPLAIVQAIPTYIPAHYPTLARYLEGKG